MKIKYTITFIPGSDFQAESGSEAIEIMLQALSMEMNRRHKKNKVLVDKDTSEAEVNSP